MSGCYPTYIEMPVCEHLVPMKFPCIDCKREDASPFIREIQRMKDRLDILEKNLSIHETSLKRKWQANTELSQRLTEVERFQEITHLQYQNNILKANKPYKCPCCDGKGTFKKEVEPRVFSFEMCVACKGKGIVWNKE